MDIVVVRGGGDIATGVIQALVNGNFKVIVLETNKPTAIRRKVALSEAIYENTCTVENITAIKACNILECKKILNKSNSNEKFVPILVDKTGETIKEIKPLAVVDAILAKRNLGTHINMANITVGLGPGFCAGEDVDVVIETMRGHDLGKIITKGYAKENTGQPGEIKGFKTERVIYSPSTGKIQNIKSIGDIVKKGEVIAKVNNENVVSKIDGVLRGLIRNDFYVEKNMKIGDVDPRLEEQKNCFTISDKARAIGGATLISILMKNTI